MLDEYTNAGLLFNQLPKLLLTSTKAVKSESDLLVKMARVVRQDESITHDHQFFRNFRNEGFNAESFFQYFGAEWREKIEYFNEGVDPAHVFAWFHVKTAIAQLRISFDSDDELDDFWEFIDSHTEIEHQFAKENYGSEGFSNMSSYLKEWLLVERINPSEPSLEEGATYSIHMVMYWGALFELFLETYTSSTEHSILNLCLPGYDSKKEMFSPSTEVVLIAVKKGWAKKQYAQSDMKWKKLYQDIKCAQMKDPHKDLNEPLVDEFPQMLVDPDVDGIKKRFDRWRNGELISLVDVRKYIAILRAPFSATESNVTLDIFILINMFTYVQKELLKAGVAPQVLADTFAKYPEFKGLAKDRFERFTETGVLFS
ncbi:hypothetical protein A1OS_23705 [Enterovibrio norvegicus]|uniref:hypothetical protein n=1 Tax=Enterovibrio norvegicus TaxID=188144 RepID=UPI0002EA6923|nr:hypothetical protein [Enterovibrio norvegicus]OEE47973.1 hypothetical protein A1OS_23705 [Enterovibrio norvegicus]